MTAAEILSLAGAATQLIATIGDLAQAHGGDGDKTIDQIFADAKARRRRVHGVSEAQVAKIKSKADLRKEK